MYNWTLTKSWKEYEFHQKQTLDYYFSGERIQVITIDESF